MRRSLSVLLLLIAVGASAPSAAQSCLSRTERQAAIAGGKALRLHDALRAVYGKVEGGVVQAELCLEGEELQYRVRVLDLKGVLRAITVDAKTGRILVIK